MIRLYIIYHPEYAIDGAGRNWEKKKVIIHFLNEAASH